MASACIVFDGRLQSLDWTGGLMLIIIFMLSNQTHSPIGVHNALHES